MRLIERLAAVTVLTATYLTILLTFAVAYLDPYKRTLVTIDTYHEANIELALLLLTLPLVLRYIYLSLCDKL